MELKTPMVFVKHIIAAQRGNAQSIQYLCERTSGQFVKICRQYNLSNSEIEAVLAKAYGTIFTDIKSVRNPQTFMSWAGKIVEDCCVEIAGPKAPAVPTPKPAAPEPEPTVPTPEPAAPEPEPTVPAAEPAAPVPESTAPAKEPIAEPETDASAETVKKPAAFYDENAYVQPSGTYNAEVNYADEAAETGPADKRLIPVDELVYHPDVDAISSEEHSAYREEAPAVSQGEEKQAVPDPSIYASIPTFASSYEEEAVFQDVYPRNAVKPTDVESSSDSEHAVPEETEPVEEHVSEQAEAISDTTPEDYAPADEPDVDLIEKEENEQGQDDAAIGVNDSDYNEDDEDEDDEDEDDEELQSGLAFRTKVLIGLLCVFIFGACVGIGYAISKGMTERTESSGDPGIVETQADTIEETQPESLVDSLIESVIESLAADSSAAETDSTNETSGAANTDTANSTDTAGGRTSDSPASDPSEGQTSESADADPAAGTGGEVTARADIAEYLGGTFASVFRDYPSIPRSVYRGELSLADTHIGFIGSYDATQPVSSTIVEAVSLLGEGGNFNINGFYVGMTSADAESLAAAGGYTALEMTAESSREYVDAEENTLSLTIDGGIVKSVTLRSATADNVTLETADDVTEEVPEEIPGEEGGVG